MRDFGRFAWPDAQAGDTRSLLIECGFHGDPNSVSVARDLCARFLLLAPADSGFAADERLAAWRQADAPQQWALEVTDAVVAKSERFRFVDDWQALQCIARAGTPIADNDGQAVLTPYDDCVLVMPSLRQLRAGVTVVRLARREPL